MCSLAPPVHLENWADVLVEAEVDDKAIGDFGRLAARDRFGKAEASRLLAHMVKPGAQFREGASRWLSKAVEEANRYLDGGWREWEAGREPWEWSGPWQRTSSSSDYRSSGSVQQQAPWNPPHMRASGSATGQTVPPPPPSRPVPRLPPGMENPWAEYRPSGP